MFNPDQLKDLALFNAYKAMQFEIAAAQAQQQAQNMAQVLEKAQEELRTLTANPTPKPMNEERLDALSAALERLKSVEAYLVQAAPLDIGAWTVEDLLDGRIVLMPNTAAMAALLK